MRRLMFALLVGWVLASPSLAQEEQTWFRLGFGSSGAGGDDGGSEIEDFSFSYAMPSGYVGTPFSDAPTISGASANDLTFSSFRSMMEGISLNAETGVISGTPTNFGSALVGIEAETAAGLKRRYDGELFIGGPFGLVIQFDHADPQIGQYAGAEYIENMGTPLSGQFADPVNDDTSNCLPSYGCAVWSIVNSTAPWIADQELPWISDPPFSVALPMPPESTEPGEYTLQLSRTHPITGTVGFSEVFTISVTGRPGWEFQPQITSSFELTRNSEGRFNLRVLAGENVSISPVEVNPADGWILADPEYDNPSGVLYNALIPGQTILPPGIYLSGYEGTVNVDSTVPVGTEVIGMIIPADNMDAVGWEVMDIEVVSAL